MPRMRHTPESDTGSSHPRQPLRIGFVTETYPPEVNGVATTLARIVGNMAARGHHVTLIRPRHGRGDSQQHPGVTSTVTVSGIPIPFYRSLRFGWPAIKRLFSLWQKERPDVIYVATNGPLGWAAVSVAARLNIPVISGFHTNLKHYISHNRLGFLTGVVRAYLRRFHNSTATTLVPTRALKGELTSQGYGTVDVMGRGVDLRLFAPGQRCELLRQSWRAAPSAQVALYVGRVAAEKNVQLAVAAFDAMERVNPEIRCVFVGDGPMLREVAASRPHFIIAGVQTGQSLARHYATADIFLFPSESETFGSVTLEAMASGLSVVAYHYAAAGEVGVSGENGLFVTPGDERAFIRAAVRLAENPELTRRLGKRARSSVGNCDWRGVCDRFESLLWRHAEDRRDRRHPQQTGVTSTTEGA